MCNLSFVVPHPARSRRGSEARGRATGHGAGQQEAKEKAEGPEALGAGQRGGGDVGWLVLREGVQKNLTVLVAVWRHCESTHC